MVVEPLLFLFARCCCENVVRLLLISRCGVNVKMLLLKNFVEMLLGCFLLLLLVCF